MANVTPDCRQCEHYRSAAFEEYRGPTYVIPSCDLVRVAALRGIAIIPTWSGTCKRFQQKYTGKLYMRSSKAAQHQAGEG